MKGDKVGNYRDRVSFCPCRLWVAYRGMRFHDFIWRKERGVELQFTTMRWALRQTRWRPWLDSKRVTFSREPIESDNLILSPHVHVKQAGRASSESLPFSLDFMIIPLSLSKTMTGDYHDPSSRLKDKTCRGSPFPIAIESAATLHSGPNYLDHKQDTPEYMPPRCMHYIRNVYIHPAS